MGGSGLVLWKLAEIVLNGQDNSLMLCKFSLFEESSLSACVWKSQGWFFQSFHFYRPQYWGKLQRKRMFPTNFPALTRLRAFRMTWMFFTCHVTELVPERELEICAEVKELKESNHLTGLLLLDPGGHNWMWHWRRDQKRHWMSVHAN